MITIPKQTGHIELQRRTITVVAAVATGHLDDGGVALLRIDIGGAGTMKIDTVVAGRRTKRGIAGTETMTTMILAHHAGVIGTATTIEQMILGPSAGRRSTSHDIEFIIQSP